MVDKMATEISGSSKDRYKGKDGIGSTVAKVLEAESSSESIGGSSNRGEGVLLLGKRVKIIDLVNKEHNNKEGVITAAMNETTGRIAVRVDDGTTWNVKENNIALMPHKHIYD